MKAEHAAPLTPLRLRHLLAYGLFGLPLALVALPLSVYVPQLYAQRFGLSLSVIGTLLLMARMADAFFDPAIGCWIDQARGARSYAQAIVLGLPMLAAGFVALFLPPSLADANPIAWFLASLVLTYAGFSLTSIAHQSWGASLTQLPGERTKITATREACGLAGILLAALIQQALNLSWLTGVFLATLTLTAILLLTSAPPARRLNNALEQAKTSVIASLALPFRHARFRWLFGVFLLNGIAAAIPATLFLFFAQDCLQLGHLSAAFLLLYFLAAAASMPLWVKAARTMGEARAWLLAMLLSVAAFIWAYWLAPGAAVGFGTICVLSGLSLGADLALPGALLAGVIGNAGHSGQREGAYFGVWNWGTKMNLALAAGIALPLLEHLDYVPGTADTAGIEGLRIAYALLPCGLKLAAAALLARAPLRHL